jgi:general secretion pathway protein I
VTRRTGDARSAARGGFTLLEVMVAMAILAISLGAVFSTEAGAIRMAARARKMGFASMLVRCKMGEIEEQILSEGFPAVFDEGTDECCKDAPIEGFSCKWEIEPVTMPETMFNGEEEAANPEEAEQVKKAGELADKEKDEEDKPTDSKDKDKKLDPAEIMKDPSKLLSGKSGPDGEGGAAPDMDAIASMAMGFIYPILKPSFESQIRRATVTVTWNEGSAEKSFDVTQYLVAEQPIRLPDGTDPNQQEGTDSTDPSSPKGSDSSKGGNSLFPGRTNFNPFKGSP